MKRLLLLICLISLSPSIFAQTQYKHKVFWGRLILSDTINNKLKWEIFLQKRTQSAGTDNIFETSHFVSIWPWLNYKLNANTRLSLSPLGFFKTHRLYNNVEEIKPEAVREFRFCLRLENEQKYKFLNYSNRYTIEYRVRDIAFDGNYQTNWRARYMLKFEKPFLNVFSKEKPLSIILSNEVFIQFGKALRGNPNIFDQNRISVGAGYEIYKDIKLNVSYLNIIQQRTSGKEIDNADALWVVATIENIFSNMKKKRVKTNN